MHWTKSRLLHLFVLFISVSSLAVGQVRVNTSLDSLRKAIEAKQIDSNTFEYFEKNIYSFANYDPGATIDVAELLLKHADSIGYVKGQADIHNHLGNIYRGAGFSDRAIEHYLIAMDAFRREGLTGSLAYELISIGNIFYDLGSYEDAESYYRAVLDLNDPEYDIRVAKSVSWNNIGLIYEELKDKRKAEEAYRSALQLRMELKRPQVRNQLVVHSYQHFGLMHESFEEYEKSLEYLVKARQLLDKTDIDSSTWHERKWDLLNAFSRVNYKREEFSLALAYADSANAVASRLQWKNHQSLALINKSKAARAMSNFAIAESSIREAFEITTENNILPTRRDALEEWIALDIQRGNYKRAVEHQELLVETIDKLTDATSSLEITSKTYQQELRNLRENARRNEQYRFMQESTLQSQKRTNTLLYILVGTLFIFGLTLSFLFFQLYKRNKRSQADTDIITKQNIEIEKANAKLQNTNNLLEESLQQKSTFMSKMSHEIRTPMNAIAGLTEVLLEQKLTSDQEQLVRNINHSSLRLTSLVDDILDYSRLEAGRVKLQERNFNISELVTEISELNTQRAKTNNSIIHLRIDSTIPELVFGDADRLGQILNNLVSNAVKFTENGHVHLRVFEDEKNEKRCRIGFEVEDNGIGIPAEQINHIFEEFQQGSTDIHARFGGTGLGLAICKQLVELMNGAIKVTSEEGKGSTFSFSIPFEIGHTQEVREQRDRANLNGRKLLLVEDDKMNQFVAERLLKPTGVVVTIVDNGQEAVDICAKEEFDIILMDIQMPIMGGMEAATRIRSESMNTSTPILALTADVQTETKEKAIASGMNEVVTKPFQSHELINAISELISATS
ncbi:ATP-binding protein [Phaeocystidibacter luteus]|uniref:histidine kinase n=1 Tax=Phaeocystidibacter luteus TaxID=911197 RepID=A0A6N6RKN6_9FLAO|nr:ATP-binding protein [Phaeocystidibacter luteus]KAB2808070.1 response regulator [Phaeocystidibacter luteus]